MTSRSIRNTDGVPRRSRVSLVVDFLVLSALVANLAPATPHAAQQAQLQSSSSFQLASSSPR